MTKQEFNSKLNQLHSTIIELQDEAVTAWREAESGSTDEEFFQEAGTKLEDMESDLSVFISEHTEHDISDVYDVKAVEPECYESSPIFKPGDSSEDIDDDELFDLDEEEEISEMENDPEEYFERHMDPRVPSYKIVSYCRENGLCTGMSIAQYNRLQSYADEKYHEPSYFRDMAVMISLCSETDKYIDDIEEDLRRMAE